MQGAIKKGETIQQLMRTFFSFQLIVRPNEEVVHTVGFIKTQQFKDPLLSY